jgi:chemotaxis protein MotA
MLQIGGIVVLFAMVFGGFLISGGSIGVILESLPHEMMTIGGAAIAALLIGGSMYSLKKVGGDLSKVVSGPKWKPQDYRDLLCLLFLLTKTMKTKGLIALEAHIEKPEDSSIFKRYPRIMKDHFALHFICDTLRMMTMSLEDPHQVESAMEKVLDKHHAEALGPTNAMQTMADGLPALGYRRGRAGRHQDHGRDLGTARSARTHDRLGAGRNLHGRVSRLWHRGPDGHRGSRRSWMRKRCSIT